MARALESSRLPGAVVVVGQQSGVVFRRAYGQRAILPAREEMTPDTIFDLASVTKPLVAGTLAQWLIEQGQLKLDDRVASHLPEFGVRGKSDVTVEQLLLHTGGLPPTNSLKDYFDGPARARSRALGSWLEALPGRRFLYSDVGYVALGALIERVSGEPLDALAERVLWKPLGMVDTTYCRKRCTSPRLAPTDLAYGRKSSPIRGEVHDPRAYLLGGVAGNAGLFSTGDDLARFARLMLGQGELDGVRLLSQSVVREFTRPRAMPGPLVDARRALGWDVSSGHSGTRGGELSRQAYGHSGYTGTSLWIDPELDLFIVFLSNRNHPYGTGKTIALQRHVADAAARALRQATVAQPTPPLHPEARAAQPTGS